MVKDSLRRIDSNIYENLDFHQVAKKKEEDQQVWAPVRFIQEKHNQNILNKVRLSKDEERLEQDIFPGVKDILIERITQYVDPKLAGDLIKKIHSIQFGGYGCNEESALESFKTRGAFYTDVKNPPEFNYCAGELLSNPSAMHIAYIISHELTHAIDPCNFPSKPYDSVNREEREDSFYMKDVLACLRTDKSVRARYNLHIFEEDFEFGKKTGKNMFCKPDQIGESYSDWMAAEVMSVYSDRKFSHLSPEQKQNGYANVYAGNSECDPKKPERSRPGASSEKNDYEKDAYGEELEEHPPLRDRANKIALLNPNVRRQMGCKSSLPEKDQYCHPGMDRSTFGKRYSPKPRPTKPNGDVDPLTKIKM